MTHFLGDAGAMGEGRCEPRVAHTSKKKERESRIVAVVEEGVSSLLPFLLCS